MAELTIHSFVDPKETGVDFSSTFGEVIQHDDQSPAVWGEPQGERLVEHFRLTLEFIHTFSSSLNVVEDIIAHQPTGSNCDIAVTPVAENWIEKYNSIQELQTELEDRLHSALGGVVSGGRFGGHLHGNTPALPKGCRLFRTLGVARLLNHFRLPEPEEFVWASMDAASMLNQWEGMGYSDDELGGELLKTQKARRERAEELVAELQQYIEGEEPSIEWNYGSKSSTF